MEEEDGIKVTLLGNTGVGKTCIIQKFVNNTFSPQTETTLVSNCSEKDLEIDGKKIKLNLWDTAGQEQYRSLGRLFYKDSHIVILVYDIMIKDTFEAIKNIWYNDLKTFGEKDNIIALVGNKSDCYEKEEVAENEAREYAKQINAHFFLVSAQNGNNINVLFSTLAKEYLGAEFSKKMKEIEEEKGEKTKIKNIEKKKGHCC